MTALDARAMVEKNIDTAADLHDDTTWTNAEVLEMLIDIGFAFEKPEVFESTGDANV